MDMFRLSKGGKLFIPVKNFGSASVIVDSVINGGINEWGKSVETREMLPCITLYSELLNVKEFKGFTAVRVYEPNENLTATVAQHLSSAFLNIMTPNELAARLGTLLLWLGFEKK